MNKATREAIEQKFPLRWEADGVGGFGVKLVATTFTYENGKVRERTIWRTFSVGAKLSGSDPETVYQDYKDEREIAWNAPENASIRAAWAAGQEMRRVKE